MLFNIIYVHGSFARRLQSTTMTMVFRFFKYAVTIKNEKLLKQSINEEVLEAVIKTMQCLESGSMIKI